MQTRYRMSLTGKLILQVLEEDESTTGASKTYWRDAKFEDYHAIVITSMEIQSLIEGEEKEKPIGFSE